LIAAADSADVTIVGSYVGQSWDAVSASAPQAFTDFVQTLVQRRRKPIVVAFGNPYMLQQLPWVSAYLVAWGGFPVSQNGGGTGAARNIRDLGSPTDQHTAIRRSRSRRGEGSSSALSQSALRIQSLSRQRKVSENSVDGRIIPSLYHWLPAARRSLLERRTSLHQKIS